MNQLTLGAIFILAIGAFTSISIMSGFHIFISIPSLFFSFKSRFKKTPLSVWFLILFSIAIAFSVFFNQDILGSFKNLKKIKYYLIGALSYFPIRHLLFHYFNEEKRKSFLWRVLQVLLISSLVATLSGLTQYFFDFHPLRFEFKGTDRNRGLFGMLMTYSHQAALLGSLLVPIAIYNYKKKILNKNQTLLVLISFTINIVGLFLSFTRGAILAFMASLSTLGKKFIAIALLIGIIAGVGLYSAKKEFIDEQVVRSSSSMQRLYLWEAAYNGFKERPLFGMGFLNFERNAIPLKIKYNIPGQDFQGHAHSNFFEILATTGIFGFISFLLWMFFWIKESIQSENELSKKVSLSFISCFIVGGLTQCTFTDGENVFFILFVFAATTVFNNAHNQKEEV